MNKPRFAATEARGLTNVGDASGDSTASSFDETDLARFPWLPLGSIESESSNGLAVPRRDLDGGGTGSSSDTSSSLITPTTGSLIVARFPRPFLVVLTAGSAFLAGRDFLETGGSTSSDLQTEENKC